MKHLQIYLKYFAALFILICLLVSIFAELISNSQPIILKYSGEWYIPVYQKILPRDLKAGEEGFQVDYRALQFGGTDFALWPPNRWDPYERDDALEEYPAPPSRIHILGTDEAGRDLVARIVYGFRYSLGYSLSVWIITSILGLVIGGFLGYKGGWTDLIGVRIIEILESVPTLILLLALSALLKPSMMLLIFISSAFGWISISYYFRAEFLRVKQQDFISSAVSLGSSHMRLVRKHLIPNSLGPWKALSPFMIAGGILSLAVLDFLGFGLPAPTPSWGELLSQAKSNFTTAWWLAVYPTVILSITIFSFNILGSRK